MLKEEMIQMNSLLTKFTFTDELTDVIENCKGVFVPTSKAELYDMYSVRNMPTCTTLYSMYRARVW